MMRLALPALSILALLACETAPEAPKEPECDLSLETLPGKTFVMLEAMADKSEVENPQARIGFYREDGRVKAKYTVKSLANVYEYLCESEREGEYMCTSEPDAARVCMAYEAHEEGSCDAAKLKDFGVELKDEELTKVIEEAKKKMAEARKSPQWKRFQMMNNNVGNTLRGVVYAKIDTRRCRLTIDDMFQTIFNGEIKEDFNPVGTNAFVMTDKEYLFEDCPSARFLADLTTDTLPEKISDIPAERLHKPGEPVHYFYVGEEAKKAEDGCTYSADLWSNWEPVEMGKAIEPGEEGALDWHVTHTFGDDARLAVGGGKKGAIFTMVRKKTCGGETETIDTVCSITQIPE